MNIIEELPQEILAIVLQYYLPPDISDTIKAIERVFNGPHHKSIIDAHTTIKTTTESFGWKTITYIFNGKQHREDGPAYERYYKNGTIACREWYINGKMHREDGPADEQYYVNGTIWYQIWYINGIELTKEDIQK